MIVSFCLKDAPSENFLGAQEEHQPGRLGEVIADNLCMRDEFFVLLWDASRNQLLFSGTGRKMRSCECRQDGHFFLAGVSCDVRWLAAVCFAYVLGTDGPGKSVVMRCSQTVCEYLNIFLCALGYVPCGVFGGYKL